MQRYARITRKLPREIVLLRGRPCVWGRCIFCDYIEDNTTDEAVMIGVAEEVLGRVTGELGSLEVLNSGSIQELPPAVWERLLDKIRQSGIRELICESYWAYRKRLDEVGRYFGIPTRIKIGVETFDAHLRNGVLKKAMYFDGPADVARLTDTICLLVGFRGQTPETVRRDIDILLGQFKYGCINLFTPNTRSAALLDDDIKRWFHDEYAWLDDHPTIEVLWKNTDYGVG